MVDPTLFNQEADQMENYQGHAEIEDPFDNLFYKSDSLLDWTILTRADSEKHYGTNGNKKKTSLGDSSTFEMRVKNGADWYSTSGGTEERTISFWKKQIYGLTGGRRALPEITLRGVSESNAAANEFVVDEFVAYIENIDEVREEGKAVQELIISGEIKTHISSQRQAAAPG